jgi:hypothetical protein
MRNIVLSAAVFLALMLGSSAVKADVVGVVEAEDARLYLHEEAGPCVGGARLARHVAKDGKEIPGCWVFVQGRVQVAFMDGDMALIPPAVVRKPTRG